MLQPALTYERDRQFQVIAVQEAPPLAYQLLMLSTDGLQCEVIMSLIRACERLDRGLPEQTAGDTASNSLKMELLRAEGTILLHVNFAAKQDKVRSAHARCIAICNEICRKSDELL